VLVWVTAGTSGRSQIAGKKMREWKWLPVNGCKCRSLIYATMEFLSYCKSVVDALNLLRIMLKNNDFLGE
jgi:hypothetical protein